MTDLSAPAKPGPRGLDLGGGRRGLAAVVVLGPLSITILNTVLRTTPPTIRPTIAAKVAEYQTVQSTSNAAEIANDRDHDISEVHLGALATARSVANRSLDTAALSAALAAACPATGPVTPTP